jgi:hypothetical protein
VLAAALVAVGAPTATARPAVVATGPTLTQVDAPAPIYGSVHIHGDGFVPNVPVLFKACDLTGPDFVRCADSPPYGLSYAVDAMGSFDHVWPASVSACAASPCRWSYWQTGTSVLHTIEIQVHDPMDQVIWIEQRPPYRGGEIVRLRGERWLPRNGVFAMHCSAGGCVHPAAVGSYAIFDTDPGGSFSGSLRLRRTVLGYDCYVSRCWIQVTLGVWAPERLESIDLIMAPGGTTAAVGYWNTGSERDGTTCAPVLLTKPVGVPITVTYHTIAMDATAGSDFVAASGRTATIPAGGVIGCARIDLVADAVAEPTKMVAVELDSISAGGVLVEGGRRAYVFVHDDD